MLLSRMTKFLKQKAKIAIMKVNEEGKPVLDQYGDPSYQPEVEVKCRRERKLRDVLSQTGSTVRSETTYYFDESISIRVGDRVDGKPIIDFEEYIDGDGKLVGYEVVV